MSLKCKASKLVKNNRDILQEQFDNTSNEEIFKYLLKNVSCSKLNPDITENFNLVLHNKTELKELLSSYETLNETLHQNIACLISTILEDKQSSPQKIRNWFKNRKSFGIWICLHRRF